MPLESIEMLGSTADALSEIGIGDFARVETPERMAWVVLLLKQLPDRPLWFPSGKLATIEGIERQLTRCAEGRVAIFVQNEPQPDPERWRCTCGSGSFVADRAGAHCRRCGRTMQSAAR